MSDTKEQQPKPTLQDFAHRVAQLRAKAVALKQLAEQTVETKGRQETMKALVQEIGNFFTQPNVALEFIGTWFAVQTEYAPFINALGPVLARAQENYLANREMLAAAQAAIVKKQAGSAPVLSIVGKDNAQEQPSGPAPATT